MRKEVLGQRNKLSEEVRRKEDEDIFHKLINSSLYINAERIFTYVSYSSEVDTRKLINYALNQGKKVYIPKTIKEKREMIAVEISTLSGLIVDEHGILEPDIVDKNKIGDKFDLIIMPGVAFDRLGNRLGYGGGYYDKYIKTYGKDTVKAANDLGYICYKWDVDTIDWMDKDNPQNIINRIKKKDIKNGSIVLMHPTKATAMCLDDIISIIRTKGYIPGKLSDVFSK